MNKITRRKNNDIIEVIKKHLASMPCTPDSVPMIRKMRGHDD